MKMSKIRWGLLVALVSFVSVLFTGTYAQASTVPLSAVDSITSSRTTFDPRATGDVTITFSEKAEHEFQPGDVLELTLPMELKGFNKNFMLEDYANVSVDENRVRVVFTDKVAKKNHIQGSLIFGVRASEDITKGTIKDILLDLGTQCKQVPTIKVKGYDAVSGPGEQKYAYKGGWVNKQDPTLIDWYIVVNPQRLYMNSDVFIRDILGPGHAYVPGSVLVDKKATNTSMTRLSMGDNNFALQLHRDMVTLKTVEISYQTKIVGPGMKQEDLKNDFTADYQVLNQNPTHLEGSFKVKNVMFDGDISGDDDLNHAIEEEAPTMNDTIEDIPAEVIEKGMVEDEQDITHRAKIDKPVELYVPLVEEKNIDEDIVETKDVETEQIDGKGSENRLIEHATEEKRPEIQVLPREEKIVEEEVMELEHSKKEQVDGEREGNKPMADVTNIKLEQQVHKTNVDEIVHPKNQDAVLPKTGSGNNVTVAVAGVMLLMGTVGARRRFIK